MTQEQLDTEEGRLYHNYDDFTCVAKTACGELFPYAYYYQRDCVAECPALPTPLWSFEHAASGDLPAFKTCVKSCELTDAGYFSVEKDVARRCVRPTECTENAVDVGLHYFGDSSAENCR